MEQVFFSTSLTELEILFKKWFKESQEEIAFHQQHHSENKEKILTTEEAASFLNLKVSTIYSKVSKGELPHMKRGKHLYFSTSDLTNYLKIGRRRSNDELEKESKAFLISNQKSW